MLLTDTGRELIEHLERQRDVPSLLASFQKLVKAFGLTAFCIGDPAPREKRAGWHWDGTWSGALARRYASQKFFGSDPIIAQMKDKATPFRWSGLYAAAGKRGRRVLDEVAEFGLADGLAIPVHDRHGPIAGISIGATHYELLPRDERALHMASLYLQARMAALAPQAPPQAKMSNLAPRERECLKWVAAGKTDWEISQILNISEQTAHGYVQSALTKLGARTRAQAVALAILSAQILQ